MSDDDENVEWEYEDESDAGDDADEAPPAAEADGADNFQYSPEAHVDGDDDGDVDWEDATEPHDEPTPSQESLADDDTDDDAASAEKTVSDLTAVNWDHINSVLQRQAEKETKQQEGATKPTRKIVRMNKHDKAHELALHKSHLLLLVARQRRLNALCQSRVLRGLLLSLTSDSALDFFSNLDSVPLKYALELLVRWFHQHFQVMEPHDRVSGDSVSGVDDAAVVVVNESDQELLHHLTENALLRVVFDRKGRHAELALLFTILCRAVGLRTRLTMALDPIAVQHHSQAAEATSAIASTRGARATRKRPRRMQEQEQVSGDEPSVVSSDAPVPLLWMWSEVLDGKTKSWVMVDALRKIVNRPHELDQLRRNKSGPLSYVVSTEDDGFVTDVTPRYVDRWSKTVPRRLAHDWMLRALQLLNATSGHMDPNPHPVEEILFRQQLRETERTTLHQLTESEEMPTSLAAFKKHHLYCLERQLGQFECIYPRKAVGLFKGHAVYLRKHVQTAHTWYKWRRLGREVRDSERERPVKRQGGSTATSKQRKPTSTSDSDGSDADEADKDKDTDKGKALYGFWQTDEVVVAACEDGRTVPKNRFGNIELWSPAHLPRGTVHLVLPRIGTVASQLGVDFAPAVVGFENRDGKNYPQIEGIVVAAAVAETLVDAHAHVQQSTIEKAIEKNQQLIVKRWYRLVKRVLLKLRLNDEYGEL